MRIEALHDGERLRLVFAGSDSLDTGCEANLQGANRLERARNYASYIETFSQWSQNADFREVRGVGHSSADMLQSRRARNAMFRG